MLNRFGLDIDSSSPDIHLPGYIFEPFRDEVIETLGEGAYDFVYNNATGETIIRGCNVEELDSVLPVLDFEIAARYPRPPLTRWLLVSYHLRLSAMDYMRTSPNGDCHLGVVRPRHPDDHTPVIGAALFRSHAVSFQPHSGSMVICRAAAQSE